MDELSKYRLNDVSELNRFVQELGQVEYATYKSKVFTLLEKLGPGDLFPIIQLVKRTNLELFIKLCCLYILLHPDYELTNDYTGVFRLKAPFVVPDKPPVLEFVK